MFQGVSNLLFRSFQYFQFSARLNLFMQTFGFDQCNFWVALFLCIQLTFIGMQKLLYTLCATLGLILACTIYLDYSYVATCGGVTSLLNPPFLC